jgi:hypothetical protein
MQKRIAIAITGGLSQTSKMPCKSISLPTLACQTGYKLAQIPGTVCSDCYANKGNYLKYAANIEPAQMARLSALDDPQWVDAMVALIGNDPYFRWHDAGDIQSEEHLHNIVQVCKRTPGTRHWMPTREANILIAYVRKHATTPEQARSLFPSNLTIRLSAIYPDVPVVLPPALRGIPSIRTSNVHSPGSEFLTNNPDTLGCDAYTRGGRCADCRACWDQSIASVSYPKH